MHLEAKGTDNEENLDVASEKAVANKSSFDCPKAVQIASKTLSWHGAAVKTPTL